MSTVNTVHVVMPDSVYDPGRPSGGNEYDRRLCEELRTAGWRVDVVLVGSPQGGAGLADALGELPDAAVVVVDGLIAAQHADVVLAAAGRLRLVLLMHMAGADERAGADPVTGRLATAAAAVLTTSRWTAERLACWYPQVAERVVAAVPGVDRAAQRPDGSGTAMLCVAAVTRHKGQDQLVAALSRLAGLDWRCTLVGSLARDPTFVADLRRAIERAGLTSRIDLVGVRSGVELQNAYAAADLLVHPSRAESYGMVVAEALAHGIPVIATQVGGIEEALGCAADGVRPGLLVPAGDPPALAEAIRSWLTGADLRRRLIAAAAARRLTLPDWTSTAAVVGVVLARVAA